MDQFLAHLRVNREQYPFSHFTGHLGRTRYFALMAGEPVGTLDVLQRLAKATGCKVLIGVEANPPDESASRDWHGGGVP